VQEIKAENDNLGAWLKTANDDEAAKIAALRSDFEAAAHK
jgi:hypothetical protein